MARRGAQISWLALEPGAVVLARDGAEVGRVSRVVADRQKDIFSGVAFRSGIVGSERFAPADSIEELREGSVRLALSAAEVEGLEAYGG